MPTHSSPILSSIVLKPRCILGSPTEALRCPRATSGVQGSLLKGPGWSQGIGIFHGSPVGSVVPPGLGTTIPLNFKLLPCKEMLYFALPGASSSYTNPPILWQMPDVLITPVISTKLSVAPPFSGLRFLFFLFTQNHSALACNSFCIHSPYH